MIIPQPKAASGKRRAPSSFFKRRQKGFRPPFAQFHVRKSPDEKVVESGYLRQLLGCDVRVPHRPHPKVPFFDSLENELRHPDMTFVRADLPVEGFDNFTIAFQDLEKGTEPSLCWHL